jgi:hypothetical protein
LTFGKRGFGPFLFRAQSAGGPLNFLPKENSGIAKFDPIVPILGLNGSKKQKNSNI